MKVRLVDIAHARSGDKGDTANVGVIALEPRWYEVLKQFLTRERVTEHFRGMIDGGVDRYELPNLNVPNVLLHGALLGGDTSVIHTVSEWTGYSATPARRVVQCADPHTITPS